MNRVGPEKPASGPKSRVALAVPEGPAAERGPSSSPGRPPSAKSLKAADGSKTRRRFFDTLGFANAQDKQKEALEEHQNLANLIKKRYGNIKLNVRRAEIFIRVNKSYLRQTQLYLGDPQRAAAARLPLAAARAPPDLTAELLIYIAFTAIFFYLVVNVIPIQYAPSQVGSFLDSGAFLNFVARGADNSAYAAINTMSDFYAYVQGTLIPLIDPDSNPDVAMFFTRLGALRLRQVRGMPRPCTWTQDPTTRCSGQFKDAGEDRSAYGNENVTWTWREGLPELRPSAAFLRDGGYSWSYGRGGYVVDVPVPEAEAVGAVQALIDNKWHDELTRAVTATFNLYNRHTGTYLVVELLSEFQAMGQAFNSARANSVQIDVNGRSSTVFGLGVFFIIFLGIYLFSEGRQMWREGLIPYITDWFNMFDVTNLGLIIALFFKYGEYLTWSSGMQQVLRPEVGELDQGLFYDLSTAVDYTIRMQELAGVAILFSCIRIFKFFELQPKLSILTNTVGQAVPDLAAFLVIFVIIFAGYAFFGWVTFGYKVDSFTTFYGSFATLFGNLGGGLEISSLLDASPAAGVFFYFSFVIVVSLILINIFIAIVGKFYASAGEEAVNREAEFRSELEPEDRMTILQKLLTLRARVSHLADPKPEGKGRPGASVSVAVDDIVLVELVNESEVKIPEGDIVAKASEMAVDDAMGLQSVPRGLDAPAERPPKVKAVVAAKKAYVLFLLEVLETGDRLVLRPPNALKNKDHELHLALVEDPAMDDGSVSLKCRVVLRTTPGAVQARRIYAGSRLRLAHRTSAQLVVSSIFTPQRQITDRTKTLFGQFEMDNPRAILEDTVLEHELIRISGRNQELREKGGGGVSGLVPARRTFGLDEMLAIIRQLEDLTKEDGNFGDAEKRNISYLVHEASSIDALHKMIVQYGKTSTVEEYDRWKARALRMMPIEKTEKKADERLGPGGGLGAAASVPAIVAASSAASSSAAGAGVGAGAGLLATPAKGPAELAPMSPSGVAPGFAVVYEHLGGPAPAPAPALAHATRPSAPAPSPPVRPAPPPPPPPPPPSARAPEGIEPPASPRASASPRPRPRPAPWPLTRRPSRRPGAPATAPRTAKVEDPYLKLTELKEKPENIEIVSRMYFRLMQLADEFDGRVEELFLLAATAANGGVHPEIIRESLRYDEMEEIVRSALTIAGGGKAGVPELKIKRETVRFLSTFPLSCFDKLIPEREKSRPFVPKPYDTRRIAGTTEDPVDQLDPRLLERIAELAHESWCIEKLRKPEGFFWWEGPDPKASPEGAVADLAPFKDIGSGSKTWNIDTVKQVIRGIEIFGYQIETGPFEDEEEEGGAVSEEKRLEGALGRLEATARPFEEAALGREGEALQAEDLLRLKPRFAPRVVEPEGLEQEHKSLVELLAKNAFNEWAHKQKEDGWTYGEVRNKKKKVDHRLVPYELLEEGDQRDNLIAPRATIASIIACGYRIVPKKVRRTALQLLQAGISRHIFGQSS
eukprot:tig00021569_g22334.t1